MPKAAPPSTISIGYLVDGDTAQPGLQVRFPPELMDLSKECQENFLSQIHRLAFLPTNDECFGLLGWRCSLSAPNP